MEKIIWLPIGLGVTRSGKVYGPDLKLRTQYKDDYLKVSYKRKFYKVHRLMAEAFLGNLHLTVNHKDGNKHNNHIDNLEMCTLLDNLDHAFDEGLHCNPKQPVKAVCPETSAVVVFDSVMDAVRAIPKAHNANIYRSIREPHRTCAGLHWEFA